MWIHSFKNGVINGCKTSLELGKIIFPVTLFVTLLKLQLCFHG